MASVVSNVTPNMLLTTLSSPGVLVSSKQRYRT